MNPRPDRAVPRSTLRVGDVGRVATVGLRVRPLRTVLTAMGIAIGIAAMVAVVGISLSSRTDLLAQLDRLGTDMLRVAPANSAFGEATTLPARARSVTARIGPVTAAAGVTTVARTIRRTDLIPATHTGGIQVVAADEGVLGAVSGALSSGRFLDAASARVPTVVLGARAAARLGLDAPDRGSRVYLGGTWFVVIGILQPLPLAPDLDSAALIGYDVAAELFGTARSPSTLYVRTRPERVGEVRAVLGRTIEPDTPNQVAVSRPSDALQARAATDTALRNLLVALGAVALLVGGVGITNVMVISVLERRAEIGLRRALGAARRHIALQFVAESAGLSVLGGLGGVALGAGTTAAYAARRGWSVDVPPSVLGAGMAVALAVGLVAGASPAVRAARVDPAEALRPA